MLKDSAIENSALSVWKYKQLDIIRKQWESWFSSKGLFDKERLLLPVPKLEMPPSLEEKEIEEVQEGTGNTPKYEKKAGQKIIDNAQFIIDAANIYGVDPNVVAGVIYAENSLNVDFKDSLTDWLGFYGVNTSIGLGQVRMSTAKLLEDLGYVPKAEATDGGWNIPLIGFVHGTENMAREKRLEDNKTNAIYVTAYIKLIEDTWEGEFPSISERPDILGTLYNIGHDSNEPHSSPEANPFGKYIGDNYATMEYLLKQK